MLQKGKTLQLAADKSGMDVKTARKYRDSGLLPSECTPEHTWRTRPDPFEEASTIDEAEFLIRHLRPKGLFLSMSVGTIVEVGEILDKAVKWAGTYIHRSL